MRISRWRTAERLHMAYGQLDLAVLVEGIHVFSIGSPLAVIEQPLPCLRRQKGTMTPLHDRNGISMTYRI